MLVRAIHHLSMRDASVVELACRLRSAGGTVPTVGDSAPSGVHSASPHSGADPANSRYRGLTAVTGELPTSRRPDHMVEAHAV